MKKSFCILLLLFLPLPLHAEEASSGFLIPTAESIPPGFQLFLETPSADGFVYQYNTPDKVGENTIANLFIRSQRQNGNDTYALKMAFFEAATMMPASEQAPKKIKDIELHGAKGVIFRVSSMPVPTHMLLLDDHGKLLEITTRDAADIHVTPEMLEAMASKFTRRAGSVALAPKGHTRGAPATLELPDVVPTSTEAQMRLLEKFAETEHSADDKIVPWVIAHQAQLVPPFLLDLSERLLAKDMDAAFEWYTLGVTRGRYDGARCVSPNPVTESLSILARTTARYAQQNIDQFANAGLKTTQRSDLFSYSAPPQWACENGLNATTVQVALKSESEWPALAEKVLAEAKAKYTEGAKPAEADIPLTPVAAVPLPDKAYAHEMSWLNDKVLVFKKTVPSPGGRPQMSLVSWDISTQTETVLADAPYLWCAANNAVAFEKKREIIDRVAKLTIAHTAPDGTKTEFATDPADPPAGLTHVFGTSINGYSASAYTSKSKLNHFDCSWVTSQAFAALYPSYAWTPLRAGDGYFALASMGPDKDGFNAPLQAIYYPAPEAQPVALPLSGKGLEVDRLQYYSFQDAYFISLPDEGQSKCQNAWWFLPHKKEVQQICAPVPELAGQEASYLPSQRGLVRMVPYRKTRRGEAEGGVYLTNSEGQTKKIWSGSASGGVMSPNGCLLALDTLHNGFVLDLCK